jgi:hypothetical protein
VVSLVAPCHRVGCLADGGKLSLLPWTQVQPENQANGSPVAKTKADMEDEAFPRGGGSLLSRFEKRKLKRDAEAAAVWDTAEEAKQKKHRGSSRKVFSGSEGYK